MRLGETVNDRREQTSQNSLRSPDPHFANCWVGQALDFRRIWAYVRATWKDVLITQLVFIPFAFAVVTKTELLSVLIGGIYVIEGLSVILQVASFKLTGKRIFKMAPIHHHFEQLGWTEPQIVIRFWIVAVVLALAGLATLKLR